MSQTLTDVQEVQTVDIRQEELIDAPIEIVWQAMLDELGPEGAGPDSKPLSMKIEAWPGGRWYRDLGNNAGHLWGHVQVIKPPALLEICGPMPMSYPAANHIQYRLVSENGSTRLKFTHRGFGLIPPEHRDGMPKGWENWLNRIRERAEARKRGRSSK
jgi:uncharacterized protein YndB with AHSA1/START domain